MVELAATASVTPTRPGPSPSILRRERSEGPVGNDTLLAIEQLIGDFAGTFREPGFNATSANAGSNGAINLFEGRAGDDFITGNGSTQVSYRGNECRDGQYRPRDGVRRPIGRN